MAVFSCLEVVLEGCRGRGGPVGLDVLEVACMAQEVPVQRVAAMPFLVIQLHVAVLRGKIHRHNLDKRCEAEMKTALHYISYKQTLLHKEQ